jgi:hypothetical protein
MKSCKCVFVGGRKVLRHEEIYIYLGDTDTSIQFDLYSFTFFCPFCTQMKLSRSVMPIFNCIVPYKYSETHPF